MSQLNLPHTFVAGRSLPAAWLNNCFNVIKATVNALDWTNLSATAGIRGSQLAAAPNGIGTDRLNDAAVTSDKLAVGHSIRQHVSQGVPASFGLATTVETAVLTFVPITTRGGYLRLTGSWSLRGFSAPATPLGANCTFRVYRDATIVYALVIDLSVGGGVFEHHQIPFPTCIIDPMDPTAGAVVKITAQLSHAGLMSIGTSAANAGRAHVEEVA